MEAAVTTRTSPKEAAFAAAGAHYVAIGEASLPSLPGHGVPFVERLRAEGLGRFAAMGLPTNHVEAWKYTSLAPFVEHRFLPGAAGAAPESLPLGGPVVTIRGAVAELSGELPRGVLVTSLREALRSHAGLVEATLGRHATAASGAFLALSQAMFTDGYVVVAEPGAELDKPLLVTIAGDGMTTLRNLVVLGRGSKVRVVEHYVSSGLSFTNAATEVALGENATFVHTTLQEQAPEAFQVSGLYVTQERDSRLASYNLLLGARLARAEVLTQLAAPGASCQLDGLYLPRQGQMLDAYTQIDHAAPHCTSQQLYKGVLDGDGRAAWTGKIRVHKDAQKTAANQTNKNLLLHDGAHVDSRPQLEIHADDVKCSHGAAIGRLDADALFYLRSRGIGLVEAQRLLTYAFASEVAAGLPDEVVRARVQKRVSAGLEVEVS